MDTFALFENLPDTVILEYLERLPEEELYNICRASKRLRDLCKLRGDTRKTMKKMTNRKVIHYAMLSDDDMDEENIGEEEVVLSVDQWKRLMDKVNENEKLKTYIKILDDEDDEEYVVMQKDSFHIMGTTDRDGTVLEEDEARELAKFIH